MPTEFLTLNDLRASLMPDGSPISSYAELLTQENEILDDIPWRACNQLTSDIFFKRTALPSVQVRRINQGFDPSKGAKEAMTETCVQIASRMAVDMGELDLAPNPAAYLLSESRPHIQVMNEHVVTEFFYGGFHTLLVGIADGYVIDDFGYRSEGNTGLPGHIFHGRLTGFLHQTVTSFLVVL